MSYPKTATRRSRTFRVLLVLGCAIALGAAAAAGGAGKPGARITVVPFQVSPGRAADASIDVTVSPRSAAPSRLAIYLPQGWGLSTSAAVGSTVGFVDLFVLDDASPLGPTGLFSRLTVADPALGTDATAQACSAGPHAAVWTGAFTLGGQPFTLRFYVDPTSGSDASLGAYRLITCLPSPYLPAEQGGAPSGMQVVELSLLAALTNPAAAGTYTWRVLVTPYVYGSATPDEANAFEARTHVLFPYVLTLRAGYQARTQALVVSGGVSALGKPQAGVKLTLFADWLDGPRDALTFAELGKPTTRSDGTFLVREPRKRILRPNEEAKLDITAFVEPVPGPCSGPAVVPGGCIDDSLSPPTTPLLGAKITVPSLAKKRT